MHAGHGKNPAQILTAPLPFPNTARTMTHLAAALVRSLSLAPLFLTLGGHPDIWAGGQRPPQLPRPRHGLVTSPLSPTATLQGRMDSPTARKLHRPVCPADSHHVSRRAWRSRRPSHLWSRKSPKTCKASCQDPDGIPSCRPRALTASLGQSNTCTCQLKPRVLTDTAS
jgi:hypothetical protein